MFADLIKQRFPEDSSNGLYKRPNLPAVKLGRLLMKEKRIASPNDVLAMHLFDGFLKSGSVLLTATRCYYDGGEFLLEDLKEVQVKGSKLTVFVNQQTQFVPHAFSVKNEQVAQTLKKVFDALAYYDPKAEAMVQQAYEGKGYNEAEIRWLELRDEVMRTIDLLYARYNDGKLSILEFEDKKAELLERL
jgi:hypothetical protein